MPEYRNGLLVSHATYREDSISLCFRIVGSRLPDSEEVNWMLEAPPRTREILGERWGDRWIIFERVIEYLKRLDVSGQWLLQCSSFANVTVDTSRIPSWTSTKLGEFDTLLIPISSKLPSQTTFPLLALGFGVAYLNQNHEFPILLRNASSITLILLGLITLVLLFREARKNNEVFENLLVMRAVIDPNYNWRLKALKLTARHYAIRYLVTAILAIRLVQIGWS